MKKTSLKEAVVAVTYRCNSRCQMCNIWKIREHSQEIIPEMFAFLPENLEDINITGGEPFLRKDLKEIIKTIKARCPKIRIIISSNGFSTDLIISQMREIIKIIPEIGLAISIDGIGEVHNKIRGIENGYARVLKTIAELKGMGVKNLKIGFTLGDYNTQELSKVYKLSKVLNTELSLTVVHSSENYFGKENKIKNKDKMVESLNWLIGKELKSWNYKKWGRAYFAYGAREFIKTGKRILPDYSGFLSVFINPQGVVYPCDVSNKKIGTLKDLKNIKQTKKTKLNDCEKSWMVCTARQSIKKHYLKVIGWIIKHKFFRIKI